MRRVLHAVGRFLPRTETFIYTIVTHHLGYEATVLCQARLHEHEFPFARVCVRPKPQSKRRVGWWVDASVERATGRSPWRRAVEAVLAGVAPDVVHAHFGPTGCELAEITAAARVPLITSLYGVDAAVLPYKPQWREPYARLFTCGDLFLAEGPEMRKKVIAAGAPPDKTVIQPIVIDLTRYPRWAPGPEPRVLFAGRFIEKKGLLDAIAAFDRAYATEPAARLTIVGDGPDEADAQALVRRLSCANAVEFVGTRPHAELIRMLAAATVLIHPSVTAVDGDSEGGAPTILLEAQAIGTPIVATRHADIPNVAPQGPGVRLCDEHDVTALGDALIAALASPLPSSSAHVAAHHSAPRAMAHLEGIYTKLVEAEPVGR
jgi:colanic acid/amylovoran/stewartan biosynthesis glycosyltransferase WcaL/AmsK/CpsK